MSNMAFGKMIQEAQQASVSAGSAKSMFLDLHEGVRIIRFLPDPVNPLEPLLGPTVLHVWLKVMRGGVEVQRRIFVDNETRRLLPESVQESVRRRFFINVYDKSKVVKLEDGSTVYANLQNQFIQVNKGEARVMTDPPALNNSVVILEASVSGGQGAGGMLNDMESLAMSALDADNNLIPITQIDFQITTRGKGLQTKRHVYLGTNRDPLAQSVYDLPVFDLANFAKPYPAAAIRDLIKGEDYGEVVKAYNVTVMPQLVSRTAGVEAKVVGVVKAPAAPIESLFDQEF